MKTKKPSLSGRSAAALFPAVPLFAVWAAALLLGACANSGETRKTPPEGKGPAPPAAGTGGQRIVPGNGLGRAVFRELDPESRSYLEALSRAFTDQDREYLLSQGEENYEAEVKPYHDEGSYLAMLYRSGAYAGDSLLDNGRQPSLDPGDILGIEYLGWEEQGPMLVIRGNLIGKSGDLPCKIVLVWRLRSPKILGLYP